MEGHRMSAYEELLAHALDGYGPTSLQRMQADGEELFAKHPVAIEEVPVPGTKAAAIREFNKHHEPKGTPDRNSDGKGDGGQFAHADGPTIVSVDTTVTGTPKKDTLRSEDRIASDVDEDADVESVLGISVGDLAHTMTQYLDETIDRVEVQARSEGSNGPDPEGDEAQQQYARYLAHQERIARQEYDRLGGRDPGMADRIDLTRSDLAAVMRSVMAGHWRQDLVGPRPQLSLSDDKFLAPMLTADRVAEILLAHGILDPMQIDSYLHDDAPGAHRRAPSRVQWSDVMDRLEGAEAAGDTAALAALQELSRFRANMPGRTGYADADLQPGVEAVMVRTTLPQPGEAEPFVFDPDDSDDFDTWYRDAYHIYPSEWLGPADGGQPHGAASLRFFGEKGTYFERVFTRDEDGLHVYHALFRNSGADGQGKGLMRGQMEAYEQLGVDKVETSANISTGSYAWARYGFTAKEPGAFRNALHDKIDNLATERHKALSPYIHEVLYTRLGGGHERSPWDMADLRITGKPEQLAGLVAAFTLTGGDNHEFGNMTASGVARWNAALKADAANGTFNLGKVLLSGMSWSAAFDMRDDDQRARLRDYIGDWTQPLTVREARRLREGNDTHEPKGAPDRNGDGRGDGGQFARKDQGGVPVEPGTTPLPKGMIRAYHYTNGGPEALASILATGLSTAHAKGSTYGEPNALWFSTSKPGDFKHYVEVFLTPEEVKGGVGSIQWVLPRPEGWKNAETPEERQEVIDRFNAAGGNFSVGGPVAADRIVTHSVPWMAKYHAVAANPTYRQMVLDGKMDKVGREYAQIVPAIKRRFGKTRESRRVREYNDCNLPAGGPDGGQFGANADSRCGSTQRGAQVRDAGRTTPAFSQASPTPPDHVAQNPAYRETFGVLSAQDRADLLQASFGDPAHVREAMIGLDTNGTRVTLLDSRGSRHPDRIDAIKVEYLNQATSAYYEETGKEMSVAQVQRTAQAFDHGMLLGVRRGVPLMPVMLKGPNFHTHPSSTPLSAPDFQIAVRDDSVGLMAVLGRDGSEYAIKIRDRQHALANHDLVEQHLMWPLQYVTASLMTGTVTRDTHAGEQAALHRGLGDIHDVHGDVHGLARSVLYTAMAKKGWVDYAENLSPARNARYDAITGGHTQLFRDVFQQHLEERGPVRFSINDFTRDYLDRRSAAGGADVRRATTTEAAAALKDAAYAVLREFNKNHEPEGTADRNSDGKGDGGQFATRDGAAIPAKQDHVDAWARGKGFASMDDFYTKRLADDPAAKAFEYSDYRAPEVQWEQMVNHAIAMGVVSPEEAKALGHYIDGNVSSNGGYKPLPPVLYHVATASTDIMQGGLKTRDELRQMSGTGLGGGESDTISFTADLKTARAIRQAMLEAHDVATGKMTVEQMLRVAEESTPHLLARPNTNKGTMYGQTKAPFYESFVRMAGGGAEWKVGDPLPWSIQGHLDGLHRVSEYSDEGKALTARFAGEFAVPVSQLPPGYVALHPFQGRDEMFVHLNQIARPVTQEERLDSAFALYKTWAFARDAAGGKLDPLFFSSDPKALAKVKRSEIRILQFKPRHRKVRGYQVSALGEWRVKTGKAVKYDGIAESRHGRLREFNPCHEPAGSPDGGRFTFKGTGNCDDAGNPSFPVHPGHGTVDRYAVDRTSMLGRQPWDAAIGKAVLGSMDPEQLARTMGKYMTETLSLSVKTKRTPRGEMVEVRGESTTSPTYFLRTFERMPDGRLVVTHDHFENHGPDAQGRALMQGQMEAYEALGVDVIDTAANISTGAYAWARYGFVASRPDVFVESILMRISATPRPRNPSVSMDARMAIAGAGFTGTMIKALTPYLPKIEAALATPSATTPWDVADLRIAGSAKELQPLVDAFLVKGAEVFQLSVKQGTKWNIAMRADQQQGVFNLGKVLMTGLSWGARLRRDNAASMKRLRAYLRDI
jgi:hypothetical protein